MDDQEQPGGGGRHRFDNLRGRYSWNMVQQPFKEQNAFNLNRKLLNIIAERDAAVEEMNDALFEKERAFEEREVAITQRNYAIKERDDAVMERNRAMRALQQTIQPIDFGIQHGSKRFNIDTENLAQRANTPNVRYGTSDLQILDALCKSMVASECNKIPQPKKTRDNMGYACATVKPRKGKRIVKDLNRQTTPDQLRFKNIWDSQNLGLNRIEFDASIMPVPGCSCTGVFRHCYKWGNGGWQSSCCTTSMSVYPLPPVPNKKYGRMGGRKMSGGAFSKLLTRLASEGFDFSLPVDLKAHWSKHGTNRYITIK